MEVRALATNQRVSPRKVRPVLGLIRGKPVEEALALLAFLPQPSARIVRKVVRSAAANAETNYDLNPDALVVKSATAGDGRRLKRYKMGPRGRLSPRVKRYCHIEIVVAGDEVF